MTAKKLRETIIAFCEDKRTYVEGITDLLIDDLLYQLDLKKRAQADIKKRGENINVSKDPDFPYYNPNASVAVVHACTKTVQSLLRQLGISPDFISKMKVSTKGQKFQTLIDSLSDN